jgi:hypothetical protein
LALVGSSIVTFLAEPARLRHTRIISAGRTTLQIPLNLPGEIISGTVVAGSAILGSKEECDITYDQFFGIHWSDRPIPGNDLLPTNAYKKVSEVPGPMLGLGKGRQARVRDLRLSAEKPCGRIVEENVRVIDLYCANSKTYVALVGMLNPVMTEKKVVEIAESLQCP